MSRNLVARPILTVGLLSASLAWMGFTLQRTVFDAARTERAASVLLDERTVRDALLQQLVTTVDRQLPPPLRNQVTSEQLADVATTTLDDPAVRDALLTAVGGTHRYLLGDVETAPTLDQSVVDAALRRQLGAISPGLAEAAPTLPTFEVPLPTRGLGPVRAVRSFVAAATPLAALVALGCIVTALLLSPTRPRVLRRVGWWAMTTGALWVALRFLVPAFTKAFLPTGSALVAGLTEALVGSIMGPGVLLAAAGAALWGVGFLAGRVDLAPADRGGADPSEASRARARARATRARADASARPAPARAARAGSSAGRSMAPVGPTAAEPAVPGGRDGDRRWGSRRGRAAEPVAPVADDAGLYVPPRAAQPSETGGADLSGAGQGAGYGAAAPVGSAPASVPRVDVGGPGSVGGPLPSPVPMGTPYPVSGGAQPDTRAGVPGLGGTSGDGWATPTGGVFTGGGQPGLAAPFAPTTALPVTPVAGTAHGSGVPLPGVELPKRERSGPAPAPQPLGGVAEQLAAHGLGEDRSFTAGPGATDVVQTADRDAGRWLGGFSLDPEHHPRVADPAPPPPRWVQGVGYVYDEPPTPNARWVDGLGYVLDDV